MKTLLRLCVAVVLAGASLAAQGQAEFKPLSDVPPSEQMPAAPMVFIAYAFVWLALIAYVFSLWRKLGRVEQELAAVSQRLQSRR